MADMKEKEYYIMKMGINIMKEILLTINLKEKEYYIMKMGINIMREILLITNLKVKGEKICLMQK